MGGNAAAQRRKQAMNAKRERLAAVVFWTLVALNADPERAWGTARRQTRDALDFAKWVGALSGWQYERMRFE